MEAVRLGFSLDVLQVIRGYASDRVGIHPTEGLWRAASDVWRGSYRREIGTYYAQLEPELMLHGSKTWREPPWRNLSPRQEYEKRWADQSRPC